MSPCPLSISVTDYSSYIFFQTVDIRIVLTTNHWGSFEIKLCPMDNNPDGIAEQECMDSNTLEIVQDGQANAIQDDEFRKGGSTGAGSSHYQIAEDTMRHNETFSYRVKLPPDVTCKRCVVQWTYTTGKELDREGEWTDKLGLSGRHVGGDESGHCSEYEIQELVSLL